MENLLDIIVVVAVGGFALYGFAVGVVQALASLVGLVFSIVVASRIYLQVAEWILPEALSGRFGVQLFVFFLLLVLITSLVNVLVKVVDKVFHVIAIIPFTKTLNRLLGFILGLIIGVIAVAAVLVAATQLPGLPEAFTDAVANSTLARWTLLLSGVVALLFPIAVERARDVIGS